MSLETEIKNLTAAVIALTAVMSKPDDVVISEPVNVEKVTDPVKKPKAKEAPAADEVQGITEQTLQALCMSIVKADRSKGASIKAAIAKFDEAKTIGQVDKKHYADLQAALQGLAND